MKTRLTAFLLAIAMLVAVTAVSVSAAAVSAGEANKEYPDAPSELYIAGKPITPFNCGNIFGGGFFHEYGDNGELFSAEGTGSATYDFNTNTLTLKDVKLLAEDMVYEFNHRIEDVIDDIVTFTNYSFEPEIFIMDSLEEARGWFGAIEAHLGDGETLTIKLYGNNYIGADDCAIFSTGNVVLDFAEGATLTVDGGVWSYDAEEAMKTMMVMNETPILMTGSLASALAPIDRLMSGKLMNALRPDLEYLLILFRMMMLLQGESHFGNITVSGGELTVRSCPDFYSPALLAVEACKYIMDELYGFTAEKYDAADGFGINPLVYELYPEYMYDMEMNILQLSPVSVIVAKDFRAADTVINVEVADDFHTRENLDYYPTYIRYEEVFLLRDFESEMFPTVKAVNIDDHLYLDNSLFYVSDLDSYMPGMNSGSVEKGASLYVRNGIVDEGGYSMQGSPAFVEFSARKAAQRYMPRNAGNYLHNSYFTDLTCEKGFFFCVEHFPLLTAAKNVLDRLGAALPFLSVGSVSESQPADTVWLQSNSFCSGIETVSEPEDGATYYVDPGEPLKPDPMMTALEGEDWTPDEPNPFFGYLTLSFLQKGEGWMICPGFCYWAYLYDDFDNNPFYDSSYIPRFENSGLSLNAPLFVWYDKAENTYKFGIEDEMFMEAFMEKMLSEGIPWADTWYYRNGTLSADLYNSVTEEYFSTVYLTGTAGMNAFMIINQNPNENERSMMVTIFGSFAEFTTTPTKIELFREVQNPDGHDYRPVEFGPKYDPLFTVSSIGGPIPEGFHMMECTVCGSRKIEPCTYDPKTGKCVCGSVDPKAVKVESKDVKVSTQKNKIPGTNLFVISVTIKVDHDPRFPVFVECMLPGSAVWTPYVIPFSLAPNQYLTELPIRVTDANHNQYYFIWEEGYGVYPFDPSSK